jgi:hypothetical protein
MIVKTVLGFSRLPQLFRERLRFFLVITIEEQPIRRCDHRDRQRGDKLQPDADRDVLRGV